MLPRAASLAHACRAVSGSHITNPKARRLVVCVQTRAMSGGGGASGGNSRALLWFRGTDLRLHDNDIVHQAVRRVEAGQVSEVGGRRASAAACGRPSCSPPPPPHLLWPHRCCPCFASTHASCPRPPGACPRRGRTAPSSCSSRCAGGAAGCRARYCLQGTSGAAPPPCRAMRTLLSHMPCTLPPHTPHPPVPQVLDLKRQLRAIGSDLMICMGKPEEVRRCTALRLLVHARPSHPIAPALCCPAPRARLRRRCHWEPVCGGG